jgi:methylated-DNA-[protein]-cysteine S-methyltransferase
MVEAVRFLVDRAATPIGELFVVVDTDGRLRTVDWTDHEARALRLLRIHYGKDLRLEPARNPGGMTAAMRAYFSGHLGAIDRLPTATAGTPFQREVWKALRRIRCGTTVSYAELARRIGRESAVRAVGLANGSNPISIVVPCHRVIGSNGTLTGYGGGLERKRWLLAHEGAALAKAA